MAKATSPHIQQSVINTLIALSLSSLLLSQTAFAQAVNEYQLKTAYIYNLTKYIHWHTPNGQSDTFQLCTIGNDALTQKISQLQGRKAKKQSIDVTQLNNLNEAESKACQILVVGRNHINPFRSKLASSQPIGLLTISDAEGFAETGGMLSFHKRNNRIQILLNKTRVDAAQLKASASLLEVCKIVRDKNSDSQHLNTALPRSIQQAPYTLKSV